MSKRIGPAAILLGPGEANRLAPAWRDKLGQTVAYIGRTWLIQFVGDDGFGTARFTLIEAKPAAPLNAAAART